MKLTLTYIYEVKDKPFNNSLPGHTFDFIADEEFFNQISNPKEHHETQNNNDSNLGR